MRTLTPASGRVLLDTSIVIAIFDGESAALSHLRQASEVFLPSTVIGELFFGAAKSTRVEENRKKLEDFVSVNSILPCDFDIAREYGRVKFKLREKGRPIPENDIWIAATALHHGLVLVTRDAHFGEVDGLLIENWASPA